MDRKCPHLISDHRVPEDSTYWMPECDSDSESDESSSDSSTDDDVPSKRGARPRKWPPLAVPHSDTSAAAYLAGEGLAQGPHAATTAQVASAARICTRLLELWRRPQGAGASFCRRVLLQEAIRGAAEETADTQRCSEWLTPRELELCSGVMRRCGGDSGGADTLSRTETHCSAPGNCALHGVARGMRPSRGGLDAIVSAPLERAHSNRTMSSDDDGFVAALRGMGIAMRRQVTAADEEEDSDDTTEDARDAFIAGVVIDDVYGMIDEMILAMADDLTESVRTAKAYAALLGLPRLAGAGARHSESDVSLRDVIGDLVETASHLSSIPSVLSCIDAIVAGVPDEDIAALFKDDKLLCFVAENGRPEAILRLLWRAGFIEPTYRNGEVSYTDTDLCEATHIQSGEDAPEPYMYSVIRDRLAARTWRVVNPLPFSIGPALRIFDSIAFKDYEWAKAASQWMRQWGKKATKKSGSEKENRKSKVSPTTGNTAAFSTTNLRVQHSMAACEGCFSLLTMLSALATARLPAAGVKRPRLEDDEFPETQQAESTSPALAKLKKSVQKLFSSHVDV